MFSHLLSGAALIGLATGILTAMWGKLRMLLSRFWSILFVSAELNAEVSRAVKAYAWNNFRRSPFGNRSYSANKHWVRPLNRLNYVIFEMLGRDPILFWDGWRPALLSLVKDEKGAADWSSGTLTFIRGTFKLEDFLIKSINKFNQTYFMTEDLSLKHNRFFIRRFIGAGAAIKMNKNGDVDKPAIASMGEVGIDMALHTGEQRYLQWKQSDLGPDISKKNNALSALSLPEYISHAVEEIKHWIKSSDWYRERQIPWTRGWLLYGKPGTGKSSFIRAVAEDLNLPVYIFDLSSMSNEEFMKFWNDMKGNVPCIAAFEDIDAVFNGRKNITGERGGGISFDCFLNTLSGIEGADGILKVITTNHIESLDDALGVPTKEDKNISTRPGRIDRVLEMPELAQDGRRKIAIRILSDCLEFVDDTVVDGEGDSGAQFTDRCIKVALEDFWRKRDNKPCDDFTPISDNGRKRDIFAKPVPYMY